eukprot:2249700-Alexandrium_andersonii.AAC.1
MLVVPRGPPDPRVKDNGALQITPSLPGGPLRESMLVVVQPGMAASESQLRCKGHNAQVVCKKAPGEVLSVTSRMGSHYRGGGLAHRVVQPRMRFAIALES